MTAAFLLAEAAKGFAEAVGDCRGLRRGAVAMAAIRAEEARWRDALEILEKVNLTSATFICIYKHIDAKYIIYFQI